MKKPIFKEIDPFHQGGQTDDASQGELHIYETNENIL